jgi:hypothetical protein
MKQQPPCAATSNRRTFDAGDIRKKANYIIKTEISRPHMIAPKDFSHTQSEQRKPKTIVPSDTLGRPKSNPLGF